jgi:hypothetical protein
LTNKVQPYCRFATAAMQMTPMVSCTHGFANTEFPDGRYFAFAFMYFPLDVFTD